MKKFIKNLYDKTSEGTAAKLFVFSVMYEIVVFIVLSGVSIFAIDKLNQYDTFWLKVTIAFNIITVITSIHRIVRIYKKYKHETDYIYSKKLPIEIFTHFWFKTIGICGVVLLSYLLFNNGIDILFIAFPVGSIRIISFTITSFLYPSRRGRWS